MAFGLCKYKNLFGEPNTGIRKYRVFNIAIVDTLFVFIIGLFISRFSGYPLWMVLLILFVTGIIAHRLFCVRTGVDKLLFPS
jgi:hypothetical protein